MNEPEQGTPEYWARTRPDTPAVITGGEVLTYGEWNERADRVAEGLAALGLEPADRVGMRFQLGIEWFVIQRALQKLGVAQVAVNWKLTPDEAIYIITDSGARGLACNDADASGWAAHDVGLLITVGQPAGSPGVRYEDLLDTIASKPRFGALRPNIVLYTSGTTGAPRGVPPLDPTTVDLDHLIRYRASVATVSALSRQLRHVAYPAGASRRRCSGGHRRVREGRHGDPPRPLRPGRGAAVHRPAQGAAVDRGSDDAAAHPEPSRRGARSLRPVVADRTQHWSRVRPAVAEEMDRRPARRGDPVGVLRGHRGRDAHVLRARAQLAKPGTSGIAFDGIEGHAVAGGLELCLACDLVVASRTAMMGLPEAARALVAAGGGCFRLPKRIPYHLAMELAITGKSWPATRFAELGLVNRLTEPGGAVAGAIELAADVLAAGPLAVRASKQIVQHAYDWDGADGWSNQMEYTRAVMASEDLQEGLRAFAEKRAPVWKGR